MTKLLDAFIHSPKARHSASVIFLHGLGDNGNGWGEMMGSLAPRFPHVKWIFPHAPSQQVTLNMGMVMPAWYDILSLDDQNPKHDIPGILRSVENINAIIQHEKEQGAQKIVLGGFSQGAAVSLSVLLTTSHTLAGLVVLSGYLPSIQPSSASTSVPIFMAHGKDDAVVRYQWGVQSSEQLKKLGYNVNFKSYPGLGHCANDEEMLEFASFLGTVLNE